MPPGKPCSPRETPLAPTISSQSSPIRAVRLYGISPPTLFRARTLSCSAQRMRKRSGDAGKPKRADFRCGLSGGEAEDYEGQPRRGGGSDRVRDEMREQQRK